jgi:hypothetical protein
MEEGNKRSKKSTRYRSPEGRGITTETYELDEKEYVWNAMYTIFVLEFGHKTLDFGEKAK